MTGNRADRAAAPAVPAAQTADDVPDPRVLLGSWSFERRIDDRFTGDVKTADGTLTLTAEEAGAGRIRWREEGTLHTGGTDLTVFRTMFVVPRGSGWFVVFEDGHDFHPWTAGRRVEHLCGADLYAGRIDVHGAAAGSGAAPPAYWSVQWDVAGPQKDYTMVTRLSRIGRPL